MKLREYREEDSREIYGLYYKAVHSVNIKDYTQEQVNAWALKEVDIEEWAKIY
ncbi:MAG: acetyltransferase [Oscillospiraceae bacterium]|nr:acetyltransferase [Oscillospiraceae bacterium]